jgi:hypothetical protein
MDGYDRSAETVFIPEIASRVVGRRCWIVTRNRMTRGKRWVPSLFQILKSPC